MATSPVSGASTTSPSSSLTLQDFMQVLMTQLTYQDPLKPMDNQEFMAQIAQFTTLQQTQELNTNMQALVLNQAAQQSVGLIGRTVGVTTSSGSVSGTVASIDLSGATPTLSVRTTTGTLPNISMSQITSVQ
jgi:flagellar basal-body rod modification protein FlgD